MAASPTSTPGCGSTRPPLGGTVVPEARAPNVLAWEAELANPAGSDASVLLVIAHPDDETVGVGGLLPRLRAAELLCVTDGSPAKLADAHRAGCATRQEYADMRASELQRAAGVGGVPADRIQMLGIADQEASLQMIRIARQLLRHILRRRPALLITHAYEGGHPDHDATALAVHAARRLLQNGGAQCPLVLEMASYHGAWGGMTTGEFLPGDGCAILMVELSPQEQRAKRKMMDCHASQQHVLAQFKLEREAFRPAPTYDFSQPPHSGPLWYERFDWGMHGPEWRRLAVAALRELAPHSGARRCL